MREYVNIPFYFLLEVATRYIIPTSIANVVINPIWVESHESNVSTP